MDVATPTAPADETWWTFVRRACLFALPLVACLTLLEARMSGIPNAYSVKRAQVEAGRDTLEALVLGSSHEFEGVNTDVFSRPSYNLAMPSQSLSQSAELGLQYVATHRLPGGTGAALALPKLRYILLGVSAYSLPYRMSTSGDPRLGFYLRTYDVYGDARPADLVNPSNYLYLGIYGWPAVQSLLRDGVTADYVGSLTRTGANRGQKGPPDGAPPVSFAASGAARAQYHHQLAVPGNAAINLDFVRRLARQCQITGVTLVLFTSPVTKEYADAFGDAVWLPRRAAIEALARGFGIAYTDYSRSDLFTWRDFGNADHLNADGAEKFARLLSDRLF
jgi:hypothetical protein